MGAHEAHQDSALNPYGLHMDSSALHVEPRRTHMESSHHHQMMVMMMRIMLMVMVVIMMAMGMEI
eukprot:10616773-Karenia_brevis.AAC.1